MKSLIGPSLAVLASFILITAAVKGQTPVTRTPARIAPTPLELWRAEVAKWEAELKRIDAELAAAQQRPATPRPMQSQSRLQTSSLQPSGRTSSLPSSAPNNQVLLQRQAAVQARLTNAQQQLARLETAGAQSSPASTPATASAAPGDPNAEAAKWNAEVTRLEQLLSRYGSGVLSFAPPAGTDPKQFAQQREALQKQLTAARAQAEQANAKVSAMANASDQAGFAALPEAHQDALPGRAVRPLRHRQILRCARPHLSLARVNSTARISSVVFDRHERPHRATIRTRLGTVKVAWRDMCGDRCWITSGVLDAKKLAVPAIERIERMAARL